MLTFKRLCAALCGLAALASLMTARAEDIDLYAGVDGGSSSANVLFFIDNTSNWSSASNKWSKAGVLLKCGTDTRCQSYVNQVFGTNTTLTQGQVEAATLKVVLNELVCGSGATLKISAGVMFLSDQGTVDSNSYSTGYIRQRIAPLDATHCAEIISDLDGVYSNITSPPYKAPSNANYGLALYEAFKYFGGWTNPAGAVTQTAGTPADSTHFGPIRNSKSTTYEDAGAFTDSGKGTYKSPITSDNACGANYIVLIGNTWPNQEPDANTSASPPTETAQTRLGYSGSQIYPVPLNNSDKSNVRFADEWAKFLFSTDVSSIAGQQNVRMYTVDVFNASQDLKQTALLKSMADQSGLGGYYQVGGDLYALVKAFQDIFTQIAAVNSVYASASLPVSVNAQGTYLNQVFIGMFRPDRDAQQRWAGNLKQYRFALDSSNLLYLADSTTDPATGLPRVAIDSKTTGFIQNCATSFWTTDTASYWQTVPGALPGACASIANSTWSDAPDGPLVERGAAAERLRLGGYSGRNLRTCLDSTCKVLGVTSLTSFDSTSLTLAPAVLSGALTPTIVDWTRGVNNGDGSTNTGGTTTYSTATTGTRASVHGEVVHSRPLAVNYGTSGTDDVIVYYGAGDGVLHAVDGNQATVKTGSTPGNELWGFIAPEHHAALARVRSNSPLISYPNVTATPSPIPKQYFFDGSIGGYQERNATSVSKVWIYPTMRRGGRVVYAFDVTNRPSTTNQPTLLWKFGCPNQGDDTGCSTGASPIGQTWSTPQAIRVRFTVSGTQTPTTLVAFGGGYDVCEDKQTGDTTDACTSSAKGRGIYVMDAQTGSAANYRYFDLSGSGFAAGRLAADLTPVDVNGDGYVDLLYGVDTRGNVFRINTSDPANGYKGYSDVSKWPVFKIGTVAVWSDLTQRRKLLNAPNVVVLGGQASVLVGSGDREEPSKSSEAASVLNRFYSLRDIYTTVDSASITPIVGYDSATGSPPPNLLNVTNATTVSATTLASYSGWYFNLSSATKPYEQVVTTPLTIGGVTYFSTFQAKQSDADASSCGLGTARSYAIDFQTGTKLPDQPLTTTFLTGGIPPSPVAGVVQIGDKKVPFLLGGPGNSPLSPSPVKVNVNPTRKPIYRYKRVE